MKRTFGMIVMASILITALAGCRGLMRSDPAIDLSPNLDAQPKFKTQSLSRPVPEGTIPYKASLGQIKQDKVPVPVTELLVKRGKNRFDIYCAACHGQAGMGISPVVDRGMVAPPAFDHPRILALKDGALFDLISKGIRSMPGYDQDLSEQDRWAVVVYVRALQISQHSVFGDLPQSLQNKFRE